MEPFFIQRDFAQSFFLTAEGIRWKEGVKQGFLAGAPAIPGPLLLRLW